MTVLSKPKIAYVLDVMMYGLSWPLYKFFEYPHLINTSTYDYYVSESGMLPL